MRIILASGSPRRIELLGNICPDFEVRPSNADETLPRAMAPGEAVEYLAALKCRQVALGRPEDLVIGADTVVALDGRLLGKPRDRADAARMLRLLSGREHAVYTGVCLLAPAGEALFHVRTGVTFYPLDEAAVDWYLDTGEPFDKAGAYGIQGKGSLLVREVAGDYFNIMGFPVARVAREMQALFAKSQR